MASCDGQIYTRTYWSGSPRKLVSGRGPAGDPLSDEQLLSEFRKHANSRSQEPTALISVSSRIIDTTKCALDKYYTDGNPAEDIWIAFIMVPAGSRKPHSAKKLAMQSNKQREILKPHQFRHEFLFDWAIPEDFVLHEVSLQTLLDRGLDWHEYLESPDFFIHHYRDERGLEVDVEKAMWEFGKLKDQVAKYLLSDDDGWELGMALASFTHKFSARAPGGWIARQFWKVCVKCRSIVETVVHIQSSTDLFKPIDLVYFKIMDEGRNIGLSDL
ncbi:hypothetical protein ACHAQH_008009 [Verticillium albo-atrum]